MIALVTGGTGYIGTRLVESLKASGITVRVLTRDPEGRPGYYAWSPKEGKIDDKAYENIDVVIHLSGAGVADRRWTPAYKKELEDSRVATAMLLEERIRENGMRLKHVISMSGAGYYGDRGNELLDESAGPSDDFLAKLCVKWEDAARDLGRHSEKLSILRSGVVLGPGSTFIQRIKPFIRWYVGAALGSGDQYVPWIHVDDMVQLIVSILQDDLQPGTYNAAAPEQVTNRELMAEIAHSMNRKILLPPIPGFVLAVLYGEMKIALLESAKLDVSKLTESGFRHNYPSLSTLWH